MKRYFKIISSALVCWTGMLFLSMILFSPADLFAVAFKTFDSKGQPVHIEDEVEKYPDLYIEKMKTDLKYGNLAGVEFLCRILINVRPENSEVRAMYSLYLASKGDIDAAKEELKKAAASRRVSPYSLYARAMIHHREKRYNEAIKICRQAISMDKSHPYPRNLEGQVYVDLGEYKRAYASFKKAVELLPDFSPGYNNIGVISFLMEDHKQAKMYYRKALEIDPASQLAHKGLALIYEAEGDYEKAIEALEKALNEEGNDVNNLDLDGNNEVDYVLIQMEKEGDTYIAFLRVAMSETEYQDVATIEMEKQSSVTATFQIVGDEALYGKDYILEPEGGVVDISESSSGTSGGKGGPAPYLIPPPPAVRVTICVGVFRPGFILFVSPFGFGRHPVWFRPWHPIARSTFRARSARMHRSHFRRTSHRRSHHANSMQKKHRKSSPKATQHKSSAAKKNTTSNAAKKNKTSSSAKSNAYKSNTQHNKSNTQHKSSNQHKGGAKKGGRR